MFGNMKQLMEMKKQADRIKRDLEAEITECEDVRGITISINGAQDFKSIVIDEQLLTPENKARFEKDLLKSLNAAIKKSQKIAAQRMASVMPGL